MACLDKVSYDANNQAIKYCNVQNCSKIEKLSTCARCKAVKYCSVEHQNKDWPGHKKACKLAQTITLTNSQLSKEGKWEVEEHKVHVVPRSIATPYYQDKSRQKNCRMLCDQSSIDFFHNKYFSLEKAPEQFQCGIEAKKEDLNQWIKEESYEKVLPFLWGEKDFDQRMAFLKEVFKFHLHPVLLLEYGRSFSLKIQKEKVQKFIDLVQAVGYLSLAHALVAADNHCIGIGLLNFLSLIANEDVVNIDQLKGKMEQDPSYEKDYARIIYRNFFIKQLEQAINNPERLGSPFWVNYQRKTYSYGVNPIEESKRKEYLDKKVEKLKEIYIQFEEDKDKEVFRFDPTEKVRTSLKENLSEEVKLVFI